MENEFKVLDLWANSPKMIRNNEKVAQLNQEIEEKAAKMMEDLQKTGIITYTLPYGK